MYIVYTYIYMYIVYMCAHAFMHICVSKNETWQHRTPEQRKGNLIKGCLHFQAFEISSFLDNEDNVSLALLIAAKVI